MSGDLDTTARDRRIDGHRYTSAARHCRRAGFCLFRPDAHIRRHGHRRSADGDREPVESSTTFEKAGERNDFGRRSGRHTHSSSGGLDEGLKRGRGEYREKAAGAQESGTRQGYSSQSETASRPISPCPTAGRSSYDADAIGRGSWMVCSNVQTRPRLRVMMRCRGERPCCTPSLSFCSSPGCSE